MARREPPWEVKWATILARVSGVSVALACIVFERDGRRWSIHPPPLTTMPPLLHLLREFA